MGVKRNLSAASPIVEAVGSGEFKQEIDGAINWGGEEVRDNPIGDEEVREMKRQRMEKPMGDEELKKMERREGEKVGDEEVRGR